MSHVIVFGNEKGGTGKSTLAMHVTVCLMEKGHRLGVIDLDLRQRSVSRYLENRREFSDRGAATLSIPELARVESSTLDTVLEREAQEQTRLQRALDRLREQCDFIIIDCPGSHTYLSRLAHALADTLVTPINDSFVDLDLIAQVDADTYQVGRLSHYAELVWESRKFRSAGQLPPTDWVVTPNRMSTLNSHNSERVDAALKALQKRIMFRYVPGLSERVIYRELFPKGLTMMDLNQVPDMGLTQMSHVTARHEVRQLVHQLNLSL
ncbi:MAG: division plane positioning ATPase MipZ [Xanthomonadales bacterium]|nr:division plane positioning ATPase MipZ [Xanthomonadales bacterium]